MNAHMCKSVLKSHFLSLRGDSKRKKLFESQILVQNKSMKILVNDNASVNILSPVYYIENETNNTNFEAISLLKVSCFCLNAFVKDV